MRLDIILLLIAIVVGHQLIQWRLRVYRRTNKLNTSKVWYVVDGIEHLRMGNLDDALVVFEERQLDGGIDVLLLHEVEYEEWVEINEIIC